MRAILLKALVGATLALIFLSQGLNAPFQKDEESRPAGIVVDIVAHGHWLIPEDLYGEATRKPPLYYWLAAGVAKARGGMVDEPGVRTISLAAGAAIAAIVIAFTCVNLGSSAGGIALLFLLGIYGFASRAAYLRTDMLFTCLMFAGYCAIYPLVTGGFSTSRAIASGVLLGLAVMTKGPLAIVLVALAIAIYALIAGINPLKFLVYRWPWIVLVIAVAIAALWYVPAFLRDPQLFRVQFLQENLGHLMPSKMGGTGEAARPFYYTILRFIGASLPLIFYLPAALVCTLPERKSGGPILYQLAMMLAVLTIFTIASSKRDDYILPALPPLAIVLSAPFADRGRTPRYWTAVLTGIASAVAGIAILTLAVAGLVLISRPELTNRLVGSMQSSDAAYIGLIVSDFARHDLRFVATIGAAAISSLAGLFFLKANRGYASAVCIGIASLATVSLWIGVLRPEFSRERTLKNFAMRAEPIIGRSPLHVVGAPEYELAYYLRRKIPGWSRSMLRPNEPCASYLIVWGDQLTRVAPGGKIMGWELLLVSSNPHPRRGHLLLLNVGGAGEPGSAACPDH